MPEREEAGAEEGGVFDRVVVVEPVGVEFGNAAGRYDDAFGEAVFDYV